jgi:hypothetical protein
MGYLIHLVERLGFDNQVLSRIIWQSHLPTVYTLNLQNRDGPRRAGARFLRIVLEFDRDTVLGSLTVFEPSVTDTCYSIRGHFIPH